jgi:hypothetical protein
MNSKSMAGWIGFAGILMLIIGGIDFFQGLIALFEDDYYVPTQSGFLVFGEHCSFSQASAWLPGRDGHDGSRSWSSL